MHAEALEIRALHVDLRERVLAARLPERARVELLAPRGQRFLDLVLDRQAVAIPARHVRRIEAVERARLDDDVLQHLVDRVADVDRAVRVRRTVVQDERRSSARDLAQLARTCSAPPTTPASRARGARDPPSSGNAGRGRLMVVL